jgi:hypothetical protein
LTWFVDAKAVMPMESELLAESSPAKAPEENQ